MKSSNIIKKLQKEGYKIAFKKWEYWDDIPHVQFEGFDFAIVEYTSQGNSLGCKVDFVFNEVLEGLYIAEKNNPVFLKKIKDQPNKTWYYSRYLILNMGDYYSYIKNRPPFHGYYKVLEQLKNEVE